MQRAAAGMPKDAPVLILMALLRVSVVLSRRVTKGTYVTPDGCPINGIITPDHRVYELVQASERGPSHVKTSPRIPRLEMPW